jgi:hypothetical protein
MNKKRKKKFLFPESLNLLIFFTPYQASFFSHLPGSLFSLFWLLPELMIYLGEQKVMKNKT